MPISKIILIGIFYQEDIPTYLFILNTLIPVHLLLSCNICDKATFETTTFF